MRLIFFIALRQLWERKLLNGIALFGVALGVLVLIAMNSVLQGQQMKFKGEILKATSHVTLFARDSERGGARTLLKEYLGTDLVAERVHHVQPDGRERKIRRPHELIARLQELPEVDAACGSLVGQAIVSLGARDLGIELRGVDPIEQERCTNLSKYVKQGSWRALSTSSAGVVLGSRMARDLGAQAGDSVRIVAPGGGSQVLKVVAIYQTGVTAVDKLRLYVNFTAAQAVLHRADAIERIDIRLRDPGIGPGFAARLRRLTGYDAESWQENNANLYALFDLQERIVAMVVFAILVVGGFGILAIQIMIVMQKTRDIAILRSVGLRRLDIMLIFFVQGVVVALLGAAVADLLGYQLIEFLGTLQIKSDGLVTSSTFLVYKDPRYYWYGLLFSLLTGVSASLLPAWRGSRIEPVDVLRGQIG